MFTHDIVFLLALVKHAEKAGAECAHQQVRRDRTGAGVSSPELPWIAMKVSARVGVLKSKAQAAGKTFREGKQEGYEQAAIYIYGLLRETWERAVEEVLFDGAIERYRHSVETKANQAVAGHL